MPELVANCPRCATKKISFEVKNIEYTTTKYGWKNYYETFSICRNCKTATNFVISDKDIKNQIKDMFGKSGESINNYACIETYINLKNSFTEKPPEFIPKNIEEIFIEGLICKSVDCFNASGTMFRLCLDMATKDLLPTTETEGLNSKILRSLGFRLEWLIKNDKIPKSLKELASCIKNDGNDGAHEGILSREDLEDIYDFTYILLERLYTEPERIKLAKERRKNRHECKE